MYIETGRDLFGGMMILVSVAIAYWVSLSIGLALIVFVGIMILQSVVTDWCSVDLILRVLGLKKKFESKA